MNIDPVQKAINNALGEAETLTDEQLQQFTLDLVFILIASMRTMVGHEYTRGFLLKALNDRTTAKDLLSTSVEFRNRTEH